MSKYIFAPAGHTSETIAILKKCIEYIGWKQKGTGSNYAKGKRFLKKEIGCSGSSIKHLFKSSTKLSNHDFEKLGLYVYRYDKYKCKDTLIEIITYIENNANETEKNRLFSEIQRPTIYLDALFAKQIDKLKWVNNHNYKDQRKSASILIQELSKISDPLD